MTIGLTWYGHACFLIKAGDAERERRFIMPAIPASFMI
jgi:hypothetical protein